MEGMEKSWITAIEEFRGFEFFWGKMTSIFWDYKGVMLED